MTRRDKTLLVLVCASSLAHPALAQDVPKPGDTAPSAAAPSNPSAPPPGDARLSVATVSADGDKVDVRLQFDLASAKGEVLCKGGRVKDGKVEFEKCRTNGIKGYGGAAVAKGLVASAEALKALKPDAQDAAKKVAFFDSARQALRAKLGEASQDKKDPQAFARYKGMILLVDRDYWRAVSLCAKAGDALKCPQPANVAQPAQTAPEAPASGNQTP